MMRRKPQPSNSSETVLTAPQLPSFVVPRYEIYVYDTLRLQGREEDDPLAAVLFHYPPNLTEEHILLSACQLVGVAQFFSQTMGDEVRFFALKQGRFAVERVGRFYIFAGDMAVNTEAGEDESTEGLRKRILEAVTLFHGSLESWRSSFSEHADEKYRHHLKLLMSSFCERVLLQGDLQPKRRLCFLPLKAVSDVRMRRISRACHVHSEVAGCLVREEDETLFSTFDPGLTHLLNAVHSRTFQVLTKLEVVYRKPLGVQLYSLDPTGQTWLERACPEDAEGPAASSCRDSSGSCCDDGVGKQPEENPKAKENPFQQRKDREMEDLTDSVRRCLFQQRSLEEKRKSAAINEHHTSPRSLTLFVHRLGSFDLIVAIYCRGVPGQALVRDLWNIGISKLITLVGAKVKVAEN